MMQVIPDSDAIIIGRRCLAGSLKYACEKGRAPIDVAADQVLIAHSMEYLMATVTASVIRCIDSALLLGE
jgi:hypothetical protein